MHVIEKFLLDHPTFEPFQPRDLRRTFKTLAGMAGIDRETGTGSKIIPGQTWVAAL